MIQSHTDVLKHVYLIHTYFSIFRQIPSLVYKAINLVLYLISFFN